MEDKLILIRSKEGLKIQFRPSSTIIKRWNCIDSLNGIYNNSLHIKASAKGLYQIGDIVRIVGFDEDGKRIYDKILVVEEDV